MGKKVNAKQTASKKTSPKQSTSKKTTSKKPTSKQAASMQTVQKLVSQWKARLEKLLTPHRPDPRAREIFRNGLWTQNPVLVLLLGLCSALATSSTLAGALGMGLATTVVLLCSNVVISLLHKYIPKEVRTLCYLVIIAGFVTAVDLCLQNFLPALSETLGIFVPLTVVNCVILSRAQTFASQEPPKYAALDGLAVGLGFTAALCVLGLIRECLGSGSIWGYPVLPFQITLIAAPCGGFLVLGFLVALVQYLRTRPPKAAQDGEETVPTPEKGGNAQ